MTSRAAPSPRSTPRLPPRRLHPGVLLTPDRPEFHPGCPQAIKRADDPDDAIHANHPVAPS